MFSCKNQFCYGQRKLKTFPKQDDSNCWFKVKKYTPNKLSRQIKLLEVHCGIFLDPAIRATNIKRKKSINLLKCIMKHSDREVLQSVQSVANLVQCSLVLVQAYVAHLKIRYNFWDKFKPNPFVDALKYFYLLIFKLMPELSNIVINTIMRFLDVERLWNVEFICCEVLVSVLACHTPPADLLNNMLDYLEEQLTLDNVKEARHVVRVLHKILYGQFWANETAEILVRLVGLYHVSVAETNVESRYFQMRRGFEVCLIRLFGIIKNSELIKMIETMLHLCFGTNLSMESMIDFSHTLEFGIIYADEDKIASAVEPFTLEYILETIGSANLQKSKLACRLLARLFDRQNNFAEFITPRVYFPNKYYKIKISRYYNEDKELFERYRSDIQHYIVYFIKNQTAGNFEAIFVILCTIIVEAPCGYTACQVIAILLEIQDYALSSSDNTSTTESNQMHAMILSIMTLIAWVHRARSLSDYVQNILNRRSDEAPHLNPPIKLSYQYAQHHVLWNQADLFFDFWEIRFCLWKRFRDNEVQLPSPGYKFLSQYRSPEVMSKADRAQNTLTASNIGGRDSIENFF